MLGQSDDLSAQSSSTPVVLQGQNNTLHPMGDDNGRDLRSLLAEGNILAWQQIGYTGSGVKVGLLGNDLEGPLDETMSVNPLDVSGKAQVTLDLLNQIAPDAQIMSCWFTTQSDFENCISELIEFQADIVLNISMAPVYEADGDHAWIDAITQFTDTRLYPFQAA